MCRQSIYDDFVVSLTALNIDFGGTEIIDDATRQSRFDVNMFSKASEVRKCVGGRWEIFYTIYLKVYTLINDMDSFSLNAFTSQIF